MRYRPPFHLALLLAVLVAVAVFVPVAGLSHGTKLAMTPSSPQRVYQVHPTGLIRDTPLQLRAHAYRFPSSLRAAVAPASYDISQWAPPVRNQGTNGSCATFATTEDLAWYMAHDYGIHYDAAGFAPMYEYAQNVTSNQSGTSFEADFGIMRDQGVPLAAQYSYGESGALLDWQDQPRASDHINAAPYKITGFSVLYAPGYGSGPPFTDALSAIQYSIGILHQPALLGINAYSPFMFAGTNGYPVPVRGHTASDTLYGGHAIVAYAYDQYGNVLIQNSWGTWWGRSGYMWVSPGFLTSDTFAVYLGSTLANPPRPVATATPVPTSTPLPTPTPWPTATATPKPTPKPTMTPTPKPTITPPMPPTPVPHKHHKRHHRHYWQCWRPAKHGKSECA